MAQPERMINAAGFFSRSGQIVDASLVAAQRQHPGEDRNQGAAAGEIRPGEPAKAAQKDTDARWAVTGTARRSSSRTAEGRPTSLSRCWAANPTSAWAGSTGSSTAHDGARLREGLSMPPTPGAGRFRLPLQAERGLAQGERHGEPHPPQEAARRHAGRRTAKANGHKSSGRANAGHVFAHQKDRMGLSIQMIGIARAKVAAALANMAVT